ncbi:MAG: hypothetical protein AAF488_08455 [Planctomycetota bacterium]
MILALFTMGVSMLVEGVPPAAAQEVPSNPDAGPGVVPPGLECGQASCPGVGTVATPSTMEPDSLQECGAPVNVQISYQGVSVNTGTTRRSVCPLTSTFRPSCAQTVPRPGCCILTSRNLWESQVRWRCECTSRSIFTLFFTCTAYNCTALTPALKVGLRQNCMNAQVCGEDGPADGCNIIRPEQSP